jgi:hypothetical protein
MESQTRSYVAEEGKLTLDEARPLGKRDQLMIVLATSAIRSQKRRLRSVGIVAKQAHRKRMSHVESTTFSSKNY